MFLLCIALAMGLALVHLRTRHVQSVNRMIVLADQERQLRQELWRQQLRGSEVLESPRWIKQQIAERGFGPQSD